MAKNEKDDDGTKIQGRCRQRKKIFPKLKKTTAAPVAGDDINGNNNDDDDDDDGDEPRSGFDVAGVGVAEKGLAGVGCYVTKDRKTKENVGQRRQELRTKTKVS